MRLDEMGLLEMGHLGFRVKAGVGVGGLGLESAPWFGDGVGDEGEGAVFCGVTTRLEVWAQRRVSVQALRSRY